MKSEEHRIQCACVQWFRLAHSDNIIFAIPNGGERNAIVAAKLKAEGVLAGVPDLFIPRAAQGYNGLFVEMKAGKAGRLSALQAQMIVRLQRRGYRCEVCRSFDDFREVVDDYLQGLPSI